jgi:hypothetical protein
LTKKLADVLMGHADHRLKTETSKVAGKKSRASSRFFYYGQNSVRAIAGASNWQTVSLVEFFNSLPRCFIK